ncbi:unnamed protein product [Bursaphelenchus okinawaensis]|uniref:Uncharacterized protein n=1 Tax=Bursaphelenchus okinawaensis TaxID=465554 RepID=A0A811JQG0_9BILA|nr:unnamed protein product [Bursaphelenchus okinawaensis]CAG9078378.1 unnamed protein product [Bursaphelenchus okinawaensis]
MWFACFGKKRKRKSTENGDAGISIIYEPTRQIDRVIDQNAALPIHISIPPDGNNNVRPPPLANHEHFNSTSTEDSGMNNSFTTKNTVTFEENNRNTIIIDQNCENSSKVEEEVQKSCHNNTNTIENEDILHGKIFSKHQTSHTSHITKDTTVNRQDTMDFDRDSLEMDKNERNSAGNEEIAREKDEITEDAIKLRRLEDVDHSNIPRPFSQCEKFQILQFKPNKTLYLMHRVCISLPAYLDQVISKPRPSIRPIDRTFYPSIVKLPQKSRIPRRLSTSVHGEYEQLHRRLFGRKYLLTKTADGNEWVRVGGGFESSEDFEKRKSRLTMGRRRSGTNPSLFRYKIVTVQK